MITRLEPDILECEDKWALGSIPTNKASGGDGIPAGLLQILLRNISSFHDKENIGDFNKNTLNGVISIYNVID